MRCPVCGAEDQACTGPSADGESVHLIERGPQVAATSEYVITETDRRGRVTSYTAKLSPEDAERLGATPVGAEVPNKKRPASRARNKARKTA